MGAWRLLGEIDLIGGILSLMRDRGLQEMAVVFDLAELGRAPRSSGQGGAAARTKSVTNAVISVELNLNPAIWEAIAGTGWSLLWGRWG
jgi:hypothetical protein